MTAEWKFGKETKVNTATKVNSAKTLPMVVPNSQDGEKGKSPCTVCERRQKTHFVYKLQEMKECLGSKGRKLRTQIYI